MPTYKTNQNRKVYAIDFDGTLTEDGLGSYSSPKPNYRTIAKVKELYYDGHIIIIWTARRYPEAASIVAWLTTHDVPFHGLKMDKGGADYYVDDKNLSLKDFNNA